MRCAVISCQNDNNSKASECSFFTFPIDAAIRKKWIKFCGQKKTFNAKTAHICMEHFRTEDFANTIQYNMGFAKLRLLRRGAVPSIIKKTEGNEILDQRATRIERRENRKTVALLLEQHSSETIVAQDNEVDLKSNDGQEIEEFFVEVDNGSQNLATSEDGLDELKNEIETLRKENQLLKKVQKNQAFQLKVMEEKVKKMKSIHDYNVDALQQEVMKVKHELTNLEKKLRTTFTDVFLEETGANLDTN